MRSSKIWNTSEVGDEAWNLFGRQSADGLLLLCVIGLLPLALNRGSVLSLARGLALPNTGETALPAVGLLLLVCVWPLAWNCEHALSLAGGLALTSPHAMASAGGSQLIPGVDSALTAVGLLFLLVTKPLALKPEVVLSQAGELAVLPEAEAALSLEVEGALLSHPPGPDGGDRRLPVGGPSVLFVGRGMLLRMRFTRASTAGETAALSVGLLTAAAISSSTGSGGSSLGLARAGPRWEFSALSAGVITAIKPSPSTGTADDLGIEVVTCSVVASLGAILSSSLCINASIFEARVSIRRTARYMYSAQTCGTECEGYNFVLNAPLSSSTQLAFCVEWSLKLKATFL